MLFNIIIIYQCIVFCCGWFLVCFIKIFYGGNFLFTVNGFKSLHGMVM